MPLSKAVVPPRLSPHGHGSGTAVELGTQLQARCHGRDIVLTSSGEDFCHQVKAWSRASAGGYNPIVQTWQLASLFPGGDEHGGD